MRGVGGRERRELEGDRMRGLETEETTISPFVGVSAAEEMIIRMFAVATEETIAKALVRASEAGNVMEVARMLEENEAAPPSVVVCGDGRQRRTALMAAASQGHAQVVKLLLDRGASLDVRDRSGYTALYWAAAKGHVEVVEMLLHKGAQATLRQQGGWNALMVAAFKGYESVVRLLLSHEAARKAVDEVSWDGETALWLACSRGHASIARVLLTEGGADPSIISAHKTSAKQIAKIWGHDDCLRVLQEYEEQLQSSSPSASPSSSSPSSVNNHIASEEQDNNNHHNQRGDAVLHHHHQQKQAAPVVVVDAASANRRAVVVVGY